MMHVRRTRGRGCHAARRKLVLEQLEQRALLYAPALVDDSFDAQQNSQPQQLPVLENDFFEEDYAGGRVITSVSYGSEGGQLQIADGRQAITYTPPADFAGKETFVYFVDGQFSANVTVSVMSPLAADAFQVYPEGQAETLSVLANDPFWPQYSGSRVITSVSTSALGSSIEIADDGRSIRYTPPAHTYGDDTFVYVVDGRYAAEARVRLPNPLAGDRYREIIQNSQNNELDVLANDQFWAGYLGEQRITLVTDTTQGGSAAVSADAGTVIYTPPADFVGWDNLRYVVDNTYEAEISIQVQRPVRDDSFEVDMGSTGFPLELTNNDTYSFYEGSSITRDIVDRVTSVTEPSEGGSVTIMADGQGVFYTAPPDFEGLETFEYVADGTYRATVSVRVTRPVRDDTSLQLVYEDTANNVLDVLANDFKGNGYQGPGLITLVSDAAEGGSVRIAQDGRSLRFTPATGFVGFDTFSYTVDDRYEADVRVYVSSIVADDHLSLCPAPAGDIHVLDVLQNDHFNAFYPGPARITSVGETRNGGLVSIAPDGKSLHFTPREGTPDDFHYVVDGKYEATVSAQMRSYLAADSYVADQNSQPILFAPLVNDFQYNPYGTQWYCGDYSGPELITSVSPTTQSGTATVVDGKWLQYTPAEDFVGRDQFTYTVDGVMQSSVTVDVIRRVRDDQFRVDVNSDNNWLPVLVNDLFGADYSGAGRITNVTEPSEGGVVTIAEDGTTIIYTPPADYTGQDTLTYTVDGALKAELSVSVVASAIDTWPRFDSLTDFEQYLIDDAVTRYANLFGQEAYPWYSFLQDGAYVKTSTGEPASRVYSETNVQVEGVDEGDIIENDGSYLYILTDGELVIADAWPAEQMSVVSRTAVKGTAIAEYLHGSRLTIISQEPSFIYPDSRDLDGTLIGPWYPIPQRTDTWLTVLDVSHRGAPHVVQQTLLDGDYVESRRIDDFVFLVLRNNHIQLPTPQLVPAEDGNSAGENSADLWPPQVPMVYESRDQYVERMLSQIGQIAEETLPRFRSYGADGDLVRTGLLHAPEELFRPPSENENNLVSVVSVNTRNDEPGISTSAGIFTSGADQIYGSLANLYVFDDQFTTEDGNVTQILKFTWNGETGDVHFAARGQVAGRLLNQFSADEFGGHLRIATTIGNSYSGNYTGRDENVLFVLHDDGGVMEFVGGLTNLALEETIRSVRFFGDRAFVTTFRQIDPLFALDLSDPARPASIGHVTLPGFNSYMQLIDEHHILAVGRNTPLGFSGPTQVSLVDVQDLSQPKLLDQYTFERFSTSVAEVDHHAFGWFAEHQLLAVPSARGYWQRVDGDGDGYRESREWVTENALFLFEVDTSTPQSAGASLRLRGEIEHDSAVRRSAFIEDVLYSVAANSTIAVDIGDVTRQFAEVRYDTDPASDPGDGSGQLPNHDAIVAEMVEKAKTRLSAEKGIPEGRILSVTAESARWHDETVLTDADEFDLAAIPGLRIVLSVADEQYLFHTDHDDAVVLVEESFEFAPPHVEWHNAAQPHDVDGDTVVTPRDALLLINELNRHGAHRLSSDQVSRIIHYQQSFLLDVDNDGFLAPRDALYVINQLNAQTSGGAAAEGEAAERVALPAEAATTSSQDSGRVSAPGNPVSGQAGHVTSTYRSSPIMESEIGVIARDVAARLKVPKNASPHADLFASFSWLND